MYKNFRDVKEDIIETCLLIKVCLTSFWFWLPVLYAAYFFIEIWLFIFVHPLTILVLPTALAIYACVLEEKRTKALYKIGNKKTSETLGQYALIPHERRDFCWNVKKSLDEYLQIREKNEEKGKE